ncbi:ZIP family metal transporter [uncultured Brachyspira sp.]|uniref:ZIP family metal transporter n=1 Tax=uncultured Brachyspira sp. TaxID=221953 RepID=UPI0025FF3284|nr:ZIP family metal transporter [uncultured Brachyspira sp.]
MNKLYSVILTLIAGLFFLLGGLISKKFKNKDVLNHFSIALAFIIMLNLIFTDLIPETLELLEAYKTSSRIFMIISFIILGILILKILDFFIPDHHHEHHEEEKNIKEHISHEKHIGTLTVISLILHNVLEGFAIFGMSLNDFKLGIMICISVALHNIPLGTHIFSSLSLNKNKRLISILTLSSLIGGIIFLIVGEISNLVLAIITCITLGMLIYIEIFELLPEMLHSIKKKETIIGLIVGLIILGISLII